MSWLIFDEITDTGLLVTRAKEALVDVNLAQSLVNIKMCYHQLSNLVHKFEDPSLCIIKAHSQLVGIDFGDDPCGVAPYLMKRLDKNEVTGIVNMTKKKESLWHIQ